MITYQIYRTQCTQDRVSTRQMTECCDSNIAKELISRLNKHTEKTGIYYFAEEAEYEGSMLVRLTPLAV